MKYALSNDSKQLREDPNVHDIFYRFDFLFIVTPIVGVCNCSMFCRTLLYVHSSIAIILMGKRALIALLNLSSWCLVMPQGCLQFVIVVFPNHTHYFSIPSLYYFNFCFPRKVNEHEAIITKKTFYKSLHIHMFKTFICIKS